MKKETRFQKIWKVIKFLLAFGLLFLILSTINWRHVKQIRLQIDWEWLIIHVVAYFMMTLIKALQYRVLIDENIKYKDVLHVVIWQNTISNFIATGAGIASYMAMLKTEKNVQLTQSAAVFVLTKFGDLISLFFFMSISAVVVWGQIVPLSLLTIFVLCGVLLMLATLIGAIILRKRFLIFLKSLLRWLRIDHLSVVSRGMEGVTTLIEIQKEVLVSKLRRSTKIAFLYMFVTMICAFSSLKMFGVQIGLWAAVYVATIMQLISFLPIQVLGGLGVIEATSVYFYSFFGLLESETVPVLLAIRLVFYLINLIISLYLPVSSFWRHKSEKMVL